MRSELGGVISWSPGPVVSLAWATNNNNIHKTERFNFICFKQKTNTFLLFISHIQILGHDGESVGATGRNSTYKQVTSPSSSSLVPPQGNLESPVRSELTQMHISHSSRLFSTYRKLEYQAKKRL